MKERIMRLYAVRCGRQYGFLTDDRVRLCDGKCMWFNATMSEFDDPPIAGKSFEDMFNTSDIFIHGTIRYISEVFRAWMLWIINVFDIDRVDIIYSGMNDNLRSIINSLDMFQEIKIPNISGDINIVRNKTYIRYMMDMNSMLMGFGYTKGIELYVGGDPGSDKGVREMLADIKSAYIKMITSRQLDHVFNYTDEKWDPNLSYHIGQEKENEK